MSAEFTKADLAELEDFAGELKGGLEAGGAISPRDRALVILIQVVAALAKMQLAREINERNEATDALR